MFFFLDSTHLLVFLLSLLLLSLHLNNPMLKFHYSITILLLTNLNEPTQVASQIFMWLTI
jgi:hypothetical protein